MSTVADYQGRTVDLLAFQADFAARGDRVLAQALVGPADGGSIVTGIEKLAQRLLLVLLTKRGSLRYAPTLGTALLADAQSGRWRTAADVALSFNSAKLALVRQLRAQERNDDPGDERIDRVELLGTTFTAGDAVLRLLLLSDAGTAYTFVTPIPVTVRSSR